MRNKTTTSTQKQELSSNHVPKGNIPESFSEAYNPVKGEMALWAAVITQALMDAGSKSAKPEAQHEKAKAIRWLLGNSEDFVTVCQNAGLDPLYVRDKARKAIQRGCVWRRDATEQRKESALQASSLPSAAVEKKYYIPAAPANQPLPLHYRPRRFARPSLPAKLPADMPYFADAPFHASTPHGAAPAYGNC